MVDLYKGGIFFLDFLDNHPCETTLGDLQSDAYSLNSGEMVFYGFQVPESTAYDVKAIISVSEGQATLYAKIGSRPTKSLYDLSKLVSGQYVMTVPSTLFISGTKVYFGVEGYSSKNSYNITVYLGNIFPGVREFRNRQRMPQQLLAERGLSP